MQEQVKEIAEIINKRCEAPLGQVHTTSADGKVIKTVDTTLIAKDIISAGYCRKDVLLKEVWNEIKGYVVWDNTAPTPQYVDIRLGAVKNAIEKFGVKLILSEKFLKKHKTLRIIVMHI